VTSTSDTSPGDPSPGDRRPPVGEHDPGSGGDGAGEVSPLREVLGLAPFRRFLAAQFLSALVNGTLRFVLVWLTLDLTGWSPAVGLVGLALGVSALVVAVPAGAISDRVDRRLLFIRLSMVTTLVLASATALVATDRASVAVVAVHAALLGGLLAAVSPAVQAMVPALVPRELLMNGVALQLITMQVALMMGAVAGGAAIALAGNAGGLGLLTVVEGVAVLLMLRVTLPVRVAEPGRPRLVADIGEGIRWAARLEPVRSLLLVMLTIGFMWGGVQLLLPDLAKDELGTGAFATSVLFAPLGVGMLVTSLALANRRVVRRRGRLLALAFTLNAGPMVVAMGVSRSYALTLVLMAVWGVGGGIVMTLQRTLLQEDTPERMMGRAMGLNTLGMLGSFPLAAAVAAALTGVTGTGTALVGMGLATTAIAALVTLRRPILHAR
jgi:MFS family permease